jgi:PA14 domain/NHL repeat
VGTPMPIAPNFLYNGITGGLTAMLAHNNIPPVDSLDPFANNPPDMLQIDPFLSVRDAGAATASFGGRPFFARWQGTITIDVTGQYGFNFQSNGATMLKIDDQMVLDSVKPAGTSNPIMLTKGLHNVDVRYIWQGGQGGNFEWYWAPPGGQQAIVPPTVLHPLARSWKSGQVPTPNVVPNVAPPPPASVGIDASSILGADAGLNLARGVGVDAKGNVYVGDNGNHRIVVLDSGGKTIATWGSETKDSAQGKINLLGDIWTTPDGHTYTLDSNNGDVQVFNPDGSVAHYFKGVASASGGITVGPDGNIYIANTINSQVLVVGPDGSIVKQFRGGADGTPNRFEQPIDVALGPDGTVYVVDMRNRISQLDANGNIVREWPVQVGIGQGGSHLIYWRNNLVMTNPDQQKLAIINLTTGGMRFVGTDGSGSSQMHMPVGLAVGPQDNLYVMDSGNNRVLVFNTLDAK